MKITKEDIYELIRNLSEQDREGLISDLLSDTKSKSSGDTQHSRRKILNNKQGNCPHCSSHHYVRNGFDKGAQRYKCKHCKRTFTEYSGTWMSGLHKKNKIDAYLELMLKERTLDQIRDELKINKKTAFDWRHKILASIEDTGKGSFTGITESDETFFRFSEKGNRKLTRKGKKRGSQSKGKGKIKDKVTIVATSDRAGQFGLNAVTMGRLSKKDIDNSIGNRISDKTILCSDSHLSFKGFAIDNSLEHHSVKPKDGIFVKEKLYHIQHVNSMHNKLKKWINGKFWGVSTKYLQQYLNWFRVKESMKHQKQPIINLPELTVLDISAYGRFLKIKDNYKLLISSQY